MKKWRNERNQPLGESRKNCTIPDAVVVRIRDLREHENMRVREIARIVNIPKDTVQSICLYRRRIYVYEEDQAETGETPSPGPD